MGEMADMAIDHAMMADEERFAYFSGEMEDEEAYDRGIIDERGYVNGPGTRWSSPLKTCAHCGCENLHWREIRDIGWRLHDANGKIHTCAEYDASKHANTGPGTPSARLAFLLDELGNRLGHPNPMSSKPPEIELLKRLDIFLEALDCDDGEGF